MKINLIDEVFHRQRRYLQTNLLSWSEDTFFDSERPHQLNTFYWTI